MAMPYETRAMPVNAATMEPKHSNEMISIEKALTPAKPDADQLITMVADVMTQYNTIVTQVTKEARDAK